jgi:hypothetical protein
VYTLDFNFTSGSKYILFVIQIVLRNNSIRKSEIHGNPRSALADLSAPLLRISSHMSLWTSSENPIAESIMSASSTSNPLEMFTSCAISDISVGEANIHTLYRPSQGSGNDIVLVMIHGYPQTHVMWRSVCSEVN